MSIKLPENSLVMLSLFLVFSLSGCELLSEEINECINKIKPKLPPKFLVYGQVSVAYFESIQAEIKNADDDAFDYEFALEAGRLPPGINYYKDGRLLKFSGTPSKAGTYKFTMKVKIPSGLYSPGDGICFGRAIDKQVYEIVVLPK